MSDEIKACPFCDFKTPRAYTRTAKTSSGKHCFVRCPICHTEGPRDTLSESNAIAAWNERTSPAVSAEPAYCGCGDQIMAHDDEAQCGTCRAFAAIPSPTASEQARDAVLEEAARQCAMDAQTIRLHAGELSGNEMRAVKAVLGFVQRRIAAMKAKP